MDTVSGAETYREPQPLQIGISEQEACPLGTEIVSFGTNRKSHVGEKHNCCRGSGSLRESRSLMAEVSREQKAETRQDLCKSTRSLLGRRVKQDCEIKLPLFSTLSLPLSICLSLPFSLSPSASSPFASLQLLISTRRFSLPLSRYPPC